MLRSKTQRLRIQDSGFRRVVGSMIDVPKVQLIHRALAEYYGPRVWRGRRDPLGELVMTILSQNTTDRNSGRAYSELRRRFPEWQAVIDAPTAEVYAAIQPAGLGNVKAPRIQRTLQAIKERTGTLSLDHLDALTLEEARAWLLSLDGVGPKTAACVLLFALGKPALPVDTHVHRVSQRLGLIGPRVSAEQAHVLLEAALPPEAVYAFHLNLIQHGRLVCHARQPDCARCPLTAQCAYFGA
jgi:endonuclease III